MYANKSFVMWKWTNLSPILTGILITFMDHLPELYSDWE